MLAASTPKTFRNTARVSLRPKTEVWSPGTKIAGRRRPGPAVTTDGFRRR
jgi:hypothetical protein